MLIQKKNWFVYLTLVLFEIFAAYALFSGILSLANSKLYPFLWYGGTISAFAVSLAAVHLIFKVMRPFDLVTGPAEIQRRSAYTEAVFVAAVLLLSAFMRIWVIRHIPITPSSDYQTYDRIASYLAAGTLHTEGAGMSGYIAEFPHTIGYSFILSLLYRVTGPSPQAGLYLNMAAGLISIFLTYRIARLISGRLGGFIALLAAAFWPSQILYGSILASEPVFTCMMLFSIWLFIHLLKQPSRISTITDGIILSACLGLSLALASAVRPMTVILLIAVVLCLFSCVVRFDENERMLYGAFSRATCQGWSRAATVLLAYFICSAIISSSISAAIDRKLPGAGVSFGYNLMVGVNVEAKGAWNAQDAEFFSGIFAAENSAEAAHRASIGVALSRIQNNPVGQLNLAMEKFTFLWANDDYASYWTALFLGQQGHLTPARQNLITRMTPWNDAAYLLSLLYSAIYGLQLLRGKRNGDAQVLVLMVVGTALLHMILESQNRYHYNILPILMILASAGIAGIRRASLAAGLKPAADEASDITNGTQI